MAKNSGNNHTPQNTGTEDTSEAETPQYGYNFYPDRSKKTPQQSFFQYVTTLDTTLARHKIGCIRNVNWCLNRDPTVKLLVGALESHGCPVDVTRHVSCERCLSRVGGGYDTNTNQVVICENNCTTRKLACSVLAHELTHMFDCCRAKLDFTNLEHLACTEIRAAQFHHCSLGAAWKAGYVSMFNMKKMHEKCTKEIAVRSVKVARDVDEGKARAVVDKVFIKCYNDLEPFGRIPQKTSDDPSLMLSEGQNMGYGKYGK